MREMKDSGVSWIKSIPVSWKIGTLKRILKDIKDGTHGTFTRTAEGEYLLSAKNVTERGVVIGEAESLISADDYKRIVGNGFPQYDDILFCIVGTIGRCCVYKYDYPVAFQRSVAFLRCNFDVACPEYVKYVLMSKIAEESFLLMAHGSAQLGLYLNDVKNINMLMPPLSEQKQISVYLDTKRAEIDVLSSDIQSEIDTLEAYKRSVITEAVTKGLDKNAPMKESGIEWMKKIPRHWKAIPFKRVLHERNEKNNPVKTSERLSLSIGLGVTTYAEKTTNLDRFKEDVSQYKLAHIGDLVMNSMNMIVGATGISKYYGCVSPAYYTFYDTESDHVIAKYCEYLFLTPLLMGELHKLGKGIMFIERGEGKVNTCRLKVSRYDLGHILLPIPPMSEMRIIVNYLNKLSLDIDEIIAKKQEQLTILADYKKSVIYEYVTGKKEVSVT